MSKSLRFLLLPLLVAGSWVSMEARSPQLAQSACRELGAGSLQNVDPAATQICHLVETSRLEELRWPDCSSYRVQAKKFYQPSLYAPAWVIDGQPIKQATAMIDLLRNADKKGLDPEDYDASRWAVRLQAVSGNSSAEDVARFDFALTISTLRYVSDLYHGRVSPKQCQAALPEKPLDGAQFLRDEIIHGADVKAAIQKLDPPFDGYRRTLAALERYVALQAGGEGPALPPIRAPLRPGDEYRGITELGAKLRRLGDLPPDALIPESQIYAEPLVSAVRSFEERNGLEADGILGHATFETLSMPLSRRVGQIKLALERWRWLPHNLGPRVLVVNIPEFRLRAYDDHRLTLTMRAIVGQAPDHQTPIFADELESIIFRPYWNVPQSIQSQELVPILRRDPAYLAKHKMEIVDGRDEVIAAPVDASILKQLASGKLHIRQQPGPANSLGLIKFVFPNQFGVYLHGTPEQGLFFQNRRDFSHGCIRIENPAELAGWVLRERPEWNEKRILAAMNATKQISVRLATPIPVLILYGTVYVEENGEIHFFQDVYGQDAVLEKALAARRP